jgi:transposase InsO family protein
LAHPNARLTPRARLEMVRQVLAGWPIAEVARQFHVSRATVTKWMRRFRAEGEGGLQDRSSAPHHRPRRTPAALAERVCAVRRATGWGPHRIAWALGLAHQTIYVVLRRAGLNRLDRLHRVTRQVVRYEHAAPGELLHVDIKKQGRVPDGGGKRFAAGFVETQSGPHSQHSRGVEYLHVAVDDHSRYAYVEALPDESAPSAAAFLARALEHFQQRGVWVQRVLTDNARVYRSKVFEAVAAAHGVRLKRTRPYRPQTNGKVERFNRTLQAEWSYARKYRSNEERLAELPRWLYRYNYRRPHGGIAGAIPASRLSQPV